MKLFLTLLIVFVICIQFSFSQNCQWAEKISGANIDEARSIVVDASGNVYLGGFFYDSKITFNNGISINKSGRKDSYLAKYNSNGTCLWAQSIGGTNDEGINNIAIDSLGNIYIIGNYASQILNFNNGITLTNDDYNNFDGFLAKYDSNGTCLWAQAFGGDNDDRGYTIALDENGNCFATGYFVSTVISFNNGITLNNYGDRDVFIAKYNRNGICQWANKIGGSYSDYATSIGVDRFGNIYCTGNFLSSVLYFNSTLSLKNSGDWDVYIAKYDKSGNCNWVDKISGKERDESWGLAIDANSDAYLTGYFNSTNLYINNGVSLSKTRDEDAFLIKINSNSTCQWAEKISGTATDYGLCVSIDVFDNIFVAGGFYSSKLDFNNGVSLIRDSIGDAFFSKYNSDGKCLWAEKINGSDLDDARSIFADKLSNIYVAGNFKSPKLLFNNSVSLYNSNPSFTDGYIAKYTNAFSPHLKLATNSPICEGDDLLLFADTIPNAQYYWYGPDGFISNQQNPIIKHAKASHSGKYFFYSKYDTMVSDTVSIDVIVKSTLVSPGDSSLIFVGSAAKINDHIKLTDSKKWDGGSIWLKNRFSVKQNFTTTFRFRTRFGNNIEADDGSLPGADGLAFVLQNHNYPVLGVKGGSMGYTGIPNSLAIEFDLFQNIWDPNGNHISVQSMGSEPNIANHTITASCLGIADKITTIRQDSIYYAKIEYDWTLKSLSVYLDETGYWDSPVLTIPNIDLSTYLHLEEGEYVYIGFTSGCGDAYQEHDLFDWTIPCKNQIVNVSDDFSNYSNSNNLIISPNPVNKIMKISINSPVDEGLQSYSKIYNISILNSLGEKVISVVASDEVSIDTSILPQGLYYCLVNNGYITTSKSFVIMR